MLAILHRIDLEDESLSFVISPPSNSVSEEQPLHTDENSGNRCCVVCGTNQHAFIVMHRNVSSPSDVNPPTPQSSGSNTIVINTETATPIRIATSEGLMKKPIKSK